MKYKLYDFQKEAVDFGLKNPYFINACQMGLGKTIQSIALSDKLGFETLVVCPAYLISNWKSEIRKFSSNPEKYKVISYDNFAIRTPGKYENLIFDEAHYLKNYKAKRTMTAHNYIRSYRPKKLNLLTGTAIVNRVEEIHSLLTLCSYGGSYEEFKKYLNYYYFVNKFCNVEIKKFGYKQFKQYTGIKNADVLKKLIKPVYFRRRAKDVLDLPKTIKQYIGDADRIDRDLEDAWDEYQKGNVEHFSSKKAVNALAKVNQTCEFVLNSLQDQKVIIFSDHVDAAMKTNDARDRAVKGLNNNLDYIVATIGAMSTGVNLQAANYMVFNDVPFVPSNLAQAEKRIHRIGQNKTCFYYYVISSDIDKRIVKTLNDKIKVINEVIGNKK